MRPEELEAYLHEHIPLTAAMAISAVAVSEGSVWLRAPLAPNINHHETFFGGSASALAIVSAWSLLHVRLRLGGLASNVVIRRNTMSYLAPVTGTADAISFVEDEAAWEPFLEQLRRKGRARVSIGAELKFEDRVCGRLEGEFVALGS
ncbi:YiiD C-terminal domain-containing protein [Radicibacter daui]|uniref:YiiD C-terminal domain-containing protein n=1 Tax=Radicibacter daui TaxID=3064829 RepID=UPI004046AB7A